MHWPAVREEPLPPPQELSVSTNEPSPSSDLPFNLLALAAYLQQHQPGFEGPLTLHKVPGGQSNPTYKLSTPGQAYVMRTKPGPVAQLLP